MVDPTKFIIHVLAGKTKLVSWNVVLLCCEGRTEEGILVTCLPFSLLSENGNNILRTSCTK